MVKVGVGIGVGVNARIRVRVRVRVRARFRVRIHLTGVHIVVRVEDVSKHYEHEWKNRTELVDQPLSRLCERRVPIQRHVQNVRQATQISAQTKYHGNQNISHAKPLQPYLHQNGQENIVVHSIDGTIKRRSGTTIRNRQEEGRERDHVRQRQSHSHTDTHRSLLTPSICIYTQNAPFFSFTRAR
jgi:hypothetical protein